MGALITLAKIVGLFLAVIVGYWLRDITYKYPSTDGTTLTETI